MGRFNIISSSGMGPSVIFGMSDMGSSEKTGRSPRKMSDMGFYGIISSSSNGLRRFIGDS